VTRRRHATLLIVCAGLFLALLAGVLWWEWIGASDLAVNAAFAPYRKPMLLQAFLWLTTLGGNPAVAAVCLTATGLLWVARLPRLVPALWTAFLGGQLTSWTVKFLVGRPRPEFLEIASAASPSFPSGHSISAMSVYGFLAVVMARHGPGGPISLVGPVALAGLVLLIGFSRMFLSVHYASDVLGGFLVGGFWLIVAIMLSGHRGTHRTADLQVRGPMKN
jgi:membrane-associated phospholipid phosphatase